MTQLERQQIHTIESYLERNPDSYAEAIADDTGIPCVAVRSLLRKSQAGFWREDGTKFWRL